MTISANPNFWTTNNSCTPSNTGCGGCNYRAHIYDQNNTLLNPPGTNGLNFTLQPGSQTFNGYGTGFDLNGGSGLPATMTIQTNFGNMTFSTSSPGATLTAGCATVTVSSVTVVRQGDTVSCGDTITDGLADAVISVTLTVN
jgi:hypothetical protein